MKRISKRWLQAVTVASTPKPLPRKAALAVAGCCLAGLVTAVGIANASPSDTVTPVAGAAAPAAARATTAQAGSSVNSPGSADAPAAPAALTPVAQPAKEKALQYDFALQPNYYYCGPASTRIVLTVLGQYHPFDTLAAELGTTTDGTPSAFDIARVLNQNLGGNVYHVVEIPGQAATAGQIDKLKYDVVGAITSDHAIVANISGSAVDVSGHTHSYSGHYVAIVGYGHNGNTVKIADPADPKGSGSYWMSTVDAANWIATRGYAVN